jgi:hypothetical protein
MRDESRFDGFSLARSCDNDQDDESSGRQDLKPNRGMSQPRCEPSIADVDGVRSENPDKSHYHNASNGDAHSKTSDAEYDMMGCKQGTRDDNDRESEQGSDLQIGRAECVVSTAGRRTRHISHPRRPKPSIRWSYN